MLRSFGPHVLSAALALTLGAGCTPVQSLRGERFTLKAQGFERPVMLSVTHARGAAGARAGREVLVEVVKSETSRRLGDTIITQETESVYGAASQLLAQVRPADRWIMIRKLVFSGSYGRMLAQSNHQGLVLLIDGEVHQ